MVEDQHKISERQAINSEFGADQQQVVDANLPSISDQTQLQQRQPASSPNPWPGVPGPTGLPAQRQEQEPQPQLQAADRSQQQSTAVAALVVGSNNNNSNNASSATKPHREPLSTIFPASKKSVKTPLISQEKFHWDQGHILGAFFYGYILFQIPGARMAESMGAKWIIMAATAGSAVISLAFPLSTQLNSIHLLMVLRFVMGLCQSAFFPAAYVLFCRWLPEKERSVLLPIMFIGSNMGSISTYIMSSYLISSAHGWPSVFYMSGLVCTIVSVSWCVFGSNGPNDNWLITDKERRYIVSNVNNQSSESNSLSEAANQSDLELGVGVEVDRNNNNNNNSLQLAKSAKETVAAAAAATTRPSCCRDISATKAHQTPVAPTPNWTKLFKSLPIWTLILSMYGNEWSNVVLCFELPTYLNTALNFPIEQNGVINSFFQLSFTVASPIMSSLGAYMLDKHVCSMRKIHVRKLFQSLATFGQLVCFVSVPICGANRGLIIMFMFSAIVFKACANAGDIMVPGDLSPEYAGTIFAFANSIGNTAGFFVPLLAGIIVDNAYEREQWRPFWWTTAAIMGCSGLIFLIFGETRRQDYSLDDDQANNHNADLELVANSEPRKAANGTNLEPAESELFLREKQRQRATGAKLLRTATAPDHLGGRSSVLV